MSFGGIQTLLTAQKGLGVRAFVAFAPAAQSWGNEALRRRLEVAVRGAQAPIFLAQAQNDYSLGPSQVLGPIVRAKGVPNAAKVYPAFGTTQQEGHAGFAVRDGVAIWSPDVFAFLQAALEGRPGTGATNVPGPQTGTAAGSCSGWASTCAAASRARGQRTANCEMAKRSCLQSRGSNGKCTWDTTWTGAHGRVVQNIDCQ